MPTLTKILSSVIRSLGKDERSLWHSNVVHPDDMAKNIKSMFPKFSGEYANTGLGNSSGELYATTHPKIAKAYGNELEYVKDMFDETGRIPKYLYKIAVPKDKYLRTDQFAPENTDFLKSVEREFGRRTRTFQDAQDNILYAKHNIPPGDFRNRSWEYKDKKAILQTDVDETIKELMGKTGYYGTYSPTSKAVYDRKTAKLVKGFDFKINSPGVPRILDAFKFGIPLTASGVGMARTGEEE
jgi:hypothetical protein